MDGQVAGVGTYRTGDLRTGGVTDDGHGGGIATVVGDVVVHPGQRRSQIPVVLGVGDRRSEAIVHRHVHPSVVCRPRQLIG